MRALSGAREILQYMTLMTLRIRSYAYEAGLQSCFHLFTGLGTKRGGFLSA